jgi:hypothetical protein
MLLTPLLFGLVACDAPPRPCTCVLGPPIASRVDAEAIVDASAAVFEGTVVHTEYRDGSSGAARLPELEVTLALGRRWKGELADTVTVRTPAATEACGADFVEGQTYLVFAGSSGYRGIGVTRPARADEVVYTTKCSPTAVLGRQTQRIATLLGRPLPPRSATGRPTAPEA